MRPPPPPRLIHVIAFLPLVPALAFGSLVNITVDDSSPNSTTGAAFSYAPLASWNQGNDCNFCSAQPNASLAYNQTWHDATFFPTRDAIQNATLHFNGTAIYVYGIIFSAAGYLFFIDGEQTGSYTFLPTPESRGFNFNVLLYQNKSLSPSTHTFVMQNGGLINVSSLALLDYAIYTTGSDAIGTPSTSSSLTSATVSASPSISASPGSGSSFLRSMNNTSVIVAATVPSVVAALILIALLIFWYRRRNRRRGIPNARPNAENASQTGEDHSMRALPDTGSETLRPYTVGRDQGSVPPQKDSIGLGDAAVQASSSPTMREIANTPALSSVTEGTAVSDPGSSITSATALRARTAPSEVSSAGVPSWFPGSEPPPAYGS